MAVETEFVWSKGSQKRERAEAYVECASPPCFMDEADPAYMGYLDNAELVDLLSRCLAYKRAAARGIMELGQRVSDLRARAVLRHVAGEEERFCAMLAHHIGRLGGTPSTAVAEFYDKLHALDACEAQFALLDRAQDRVAVTLREALPKISAALLHAILREMLTAHERNMQRVRALHASEGLS